MDIFVSLDLGLVSSREIGSRFLLISNIYTIFASRLGFIREKIIFIFQLLSSTFEIKLIICSIT